MKLGIANRIVVEDVDLNETVECPRFSYTDAVVLVDGGLLDLAQIVLTNLERER